MKQLLLLLSLSIVIAINGQTDSIEKALLYNKVLNKELKAHEYSDLAKHWNTTKEKVGYYPELPRNPSGQVHLSVLHEIHDLDKEYIINRTLEWLAINYELYPQYMYSKKETGKFIFTNSFQINDYYTCIYTGIITIKDNKLLYEILNIKYLAYSPGYYKGTFWIPEKNETIKIENLYPIISKDKSKWKNYMKITKALKERFECDTKNIYTYVTEYKILSDF